MGNRYQLNFFKVPKKKCNGNLHKKTDIYVIRKNSDYAYAERLGLIYWHGAWRKYAFFPDEDTLWDQSCLVEIAAFLIKINREHRWKK